jgi:hypothetical protein
MSGKDDKPIALETRERTEDARQFSPSSARNKDPILDVLRHHVPEGTPGSVKVLEVASGTGEHAVHFTRGLEQVLWQPSDPDEMARASVAAWTQHEGIHRILPPVEIDARAEVWPVDDQVPFQVIISINMIHIAPWEACLGLLSGAGRLLTTGGGVLFLYGPFKRGGIHSAPSNAAFDESLQARDPRWGVRDLDEVAKMATTHGLASGDVISMPANNFCAIFTKT